MTAGSQRCCTGIFIAFILTRHWIVFTQYYCFSTCPENENLAPDVICGPVVWTASQIPPKSMDTKDWTWRMVVLPLIFLPHWNINGRPANQEHRQTGIENTSYNSLLSSTKIIKETLLVHQALSLNGDMYTEERSHLSNLCSQQVCFCHGLLRKRFKTLVPLLLCIRHSILPLYLTESTEIDFKHTCTCNRNI